MKMIHLGLGMLVMVQLMLVTDASMGGVEDACPVGWTRQGDHCYKALPAMADDDDGDDMSDADTACINQDVYFTSSQLVEPKTQELNDELAAFLTSQDITEGVWIGLRPNSDKTLWVWRNGVEATWFPGQHGTPDYCNTAKKDGTWGNVFCNKIRQPVCVRDPDQGLLTWACLDDRVRMLKNPQAPAAIGCRSTLTCSAIDVTDDGSIANVMTVNLRQASHGGIQADIDVMSDTDQKVTIAFTESSSPGDTCDAESLGLFLSHTTHDYRGRHVDNSVVAEAEIRAGVKATFVVSRLDGVSSLNSLAGHGMVVCPSDKVDEANGFKRCLSDHIRLCCSMSWVLEEDQQWLDDLVAAHHHHPH